MLSATVIYVSLWASFRLWPSWEATALAIPYAGPALQAFLALYVAAMIAWMAWHLVLSLLG